MKSKEILLWVVAVAALCLSFLAIFGPKLQGLKSQAAISRSQISNIQNAGQIISNGGSDSTPSEGDPCIFWTSDGKQHTGRLFEIRGEDDASTGVFVCTSADGYYGNNWILANPSQ